MKQSLPSILCAAFLAALTCVTGPAIAQKSAEPLRCEETTRQLDRELSALSKRLVDQREKQVQSDRTATTRVLIELSEMDSLRAHLRCLGLGPVTQK